MTIWHDVRYAFRTLRKAPAFSVVSALTLTLGIIGTAAVFQAYDAVALRPLSVSDPKTVAILKRQLVKGGVAEEFSADDLLIFRDQSSTIQGVAAETEYETILARLPGTPDRPSTASLQVIAKGVSDNYFQLLGVRAALGRLFNAAESSNSEPVVVLSYSSWQRRFRGDPQVVGKTVLLSGSAFIVIGIAPHDFIGTGLPPVPPDVWLPLRFQSLAVPGAFASSSEPRLRLAVRLKPGASQAQAVAELSAAARQAEQAAGKPGTTSAIVLTAPASLVEHNDPQFLTLAALLTGIFVLVLVITCANLTNLSLARAAARRKELGVRRALGASRGRIVRYLLVEGAMLGLAAGVLAVFTARWICELVWFEVQQRLISRFTDLYVFTFDFHPDWRVLLCTLAFALLTGVLFSLLPALQCSRVDVQEALQGHVMQVGISRRRLRLNLRDLLIAIQITLSLILLVNAALLARGMLRAQTTKPSFDTSHVLDIEFANPATAGITVANVDDFRQQLVQRLATAPGIRDVAFATHVPLLGFIRTDIALNGRREPAAANQVSPRFFSVFGIALVSGRDFTASEFESGSPVCIVSASTAQKLWPNQDPLGRLLVVSAAQKPLQVIGVAADADVVNLGGKPLFVYLPLPRKRLDADVFIRTAAYAGSSSGIVLEQLGAINPNLAALASIHSMDDALWYQHLPSTIATAFATSVGSLALLLAVIGIYGTVAYSVAQRTREIGIRIAPGAQPLSIVSLVLGRVLALAGGAVAIGAVLAGLVSRIIVALPFELGSRLLFGVSWRDPLVLASIAAALTTIAICAAWLPARSASRVDPMVALRYE